MDDEGCLSESAYDELSSARDRAYDERNQLVAFLTRLYPSYWYVDASQDQCWSTVICVLGPQGQMTWHVSLDDKERYFWHLWRGHGRWDGHTTEEKYQRLALCP